MFNKTKIDESRRKQFLNKASMNGNNITSLLTGANWAPLGEAAPCTALTYHKSSADLS